VGEGLVVSILGGALGAIAARLTNQRRVSADERRLHSRIWRE
jgi:hypothetical protein